MSINRRSQQLDRITSSSGSNDVEENQNMAERSTAQGSCERALEYRGGYSVMSPNEKKRTEIQAQAQREMENYEKYKSGLGYGYVSERPAAVGGPSVSKNKVIESLQTKQRQAERKSLHEGRKKREQWQAEKKRKEDEEINARKAEARNQAEKNERKSQQREAERNEQFREEQRSRNLAFFDNKFGNNQRDEKKDTTLSDSSQQSWKREDQEWSVSQIQHSSSDNDIDTLNEMFPNLGLANIVDIYKSTDMNLHLSADILASSK